MTSQTILASAIAVDMTLLIDGQHHIVTAVSDYDPEAIYVDAETVVGDMGPRSFRFDATDAVSTVA